MAELAGFTAGRIVHFVLDSGLCLGEHRPAIIVKTHDNGTGCANLTVFIDRLNDGDPGSTNGLYEATIWRSSVLFSEKKEPGTWHWIEHV